MLFENDNCLHITCFKLWIMQQHTFHVFEAVSIFFFFFVQKYVWIVIYGMQICLNLSKATREPKLFASTENATTTVTSVRFMLWLNSLNLKFLPVRTGGQERTKNVLIMGILNWIGIQTTDYFDSHVRRWRMAVKSKSNPYTDRTPFELLSCTP